MARIYRRAGFAVAIEGAFDPAEIERCLAEQGLGADLRVVLAPQIHVAMARNRERTNKPFDTTVLEEAISEIDRSIRDEALPPDWVVVDNSDEALEETVARIRAMLTGDAGLAPETPGA